MTSAAGLDHTLAMRFCVSIRVHDGMRDIGMWLNCLACSLMMLGITHRLWLLLWLLIHLLLLRQTVILQRSAAEVAEPHLVNAMQFSSTIRANGSRSVIGLLFAISRQLDTLDRELKQALGTNDHIITRRKLFARYIHVLATMRTCNFHLGFIF